MKKFAVLAALCALGACASTPPPPPTERPVVEATACPDLAVTIYFDPTATTVPASADPVMATVSETIARCKARFSPVKRVEIAGHANRGADGATADSSAAARAQSVRTKIVDLGVRPGRVKIVAHDAIDDDPDQPLRRHADVKITFSVQD
jgi:outer membrane protein OmpA-like peptidoglycan-associated protein